MLPDHADPDDVCPLCGAPLALPEADDGYIFLPLPRCPRCFSADLEMLRSEDQGDGSRVRWYRCPKCPHSFRAIFE